MYKLLLLCLFVLPLTGCFDILEHIVVKSDGSAELRVEVALDSGFIRMMSMADFDDTVRSLSACGDTIVKQFIERKKQYAGVKGITHSTVDHSFTGDSTLVITTVLGIDDVLRIPTMHALFWDIDRKEKSNDPTAFPIAFNVRRQSKKGSFDFAFSPRPAVAKDKRKITTRDTANISSIQGRTLEIRLSAPFVTAQGHSTDAQNAAWKLPLRELVLRNKDVMKGSARIQLNK